MNSQEIHPRFFVESVLLAAGRPLTEDEINSRLPRPVDVRRWLLMLQEEYADRGIILQEVRPQQWAMRTRPEYSALAARFAEKPQRLSRAALETLYVIAYFQPVTRGEMERIRGVQSVKGTMDSLIANGWVKPGPRRSAPGNPMTFLTTEKFLDDFDYKSLNELPNIDQMKTEGLLDKDFGVDLPVETVEE